MAKQEAPQFGRVLPIKGKDGTIYGLKVFPFKQEGGGLDFEAGVLVWKRDVEDILSGRISSGTAFVDVPLKPQDKPVVQSRGSR